jgi:C4-type Zn-finger protein
MLYELSTFRWHQMLNCSREVIESRRHPTVALQEPMSYSLTLRWMLNAEPLKKDIVNSLPRNMLHEGNRDEPSWL